MLFESVLYEWIELKKLEIRNSSYKNYMYIIKNRVSPAFGNTEIEDITKKQIQAFIILQSDKLPKRLNMH